MILNMPQLNRPVPALGPEHFKSYEVSRPRSTHFRKATCREVECPNYERGWRTTCDISTELGQQQAAYITKRSGRTYTAHSVGDMLTFTFPAEQLCFSQHTVPLDREPFFAVKAGDWRRYGTTQQLRVRDWLDDFGAHQLRIAEQRQRG